MEAAGSIEDVISREIIRKLRLVRRDGRHMRRFAWGDILHGWHPTRPPRAAAGRRQRRLSGRRTVKLFARRYSSTSPARLMLQPGVRDACRRRHCSQGEQARQQAWSGLRVQGLGPKPPPHHHHHRPTTCREAQPAATPAHQLLPGAWPALHAGGWGGRRGLGAAGSWPPPQHRP